MHGRALFAQHAVAFALVFMVAHQAAHGGQGIVFKEHPTRFVELSVEHQADDLGNRSVDGATLLALGHLAVEAALGFFQNMNGHMQHPFFGMVYK